jgi:hypothetical protein
MYSLEFIEISLIILTHYYVGSATCAVFCDKEWSAEGSEWKAPIRSMSPDNMHPLTQKLHRNGRKLGLHLKQMTSIKYEYKTRILPATFLNSVKYFPVVLPGPVSCLHPGLCLSPPILRDLLLFVCITWYFRNLAHFNPEDGCTMFLRNGATNVRDYTVSWTRMPQI